VWELDFRSHKTEVLGYIAITGAGPVVVDTGAGQIPDAPKGSTACPSQIFTREK